VCLTDSIEINGTFAFIANTPSGQSIAVRPRGVARNVLVRFMHLDPRQLLFQERIKDFKLNDYLLRCINETIAKRCGIQYVRPRDPADPDPDPDAEGGGDGDHKEGSADMGALEPLLALLPLRDPLAVTVPDDERDPFVLSWRHVDPPYVAEVWPSSYAVEPLDRLGAQVLRLDEKEDDITYRQVTRRSNLGYHSKDQTWLEVDFQTKSGYNKFLKQFRQPEGPSGQYVKGLRPLFLPHRESESIVRVDVFHSDIKAENRFLASKGLNLNSGCRLINPRLVHDSDDDNDNGHHAGSGGGGGAGGGWRRRTPSRLAKTCVAEFLVDDIVPDASYIQDNSTVCYYHVTQQHGAAHTISCILRKGNAQPPMLLVLTRGSQMNKAEVPDLTEELRQVLESRGQNGKPMQFNVHTFRDEASLIRAFFDTISARDFDVLVSLDGLSDKMAFLAGRLDVLKVPLPDCSRVNDGASLEVKNRKRESIHGGDKDFDWLEIPGRAQVDVMNCDRDLKLTISNYFTVLDGLLHPSNKFQPGFDFLRALHDEEFSGLRVIDLPAVNLPARPDEPFREAVWTSIFCWLAEQDKKLLLELKQVSAISNTPLTALLFQGDFLRVSNLLYLNTFPQWVPGQGDVESHTVLTHQVDLLRENWIAALSSLEQAESSKKSQKDEQEELEPECELLDAFLNLNISKANGTSKSKSKKRAKSEKSAKSTSGKTRTKKRTVTPANPANPAPRVQQAHSRPFIRVEGGRVLKPKPGLYHGPIAILDFAGMYPTIVRSGFDLATMVRTRAEARYLQRRLGKKILHQNAVRVERTSADGRVSRVNAALFFVDDPNFPAKYKLIMESCTKLTERRATLKKLLKAAIQEGDTFRAALYKSQEQATKKMNNSVYGVMKLIYPAFAGAITWKGRNFHEKMLEFTCGLDLVAGAITWGWALYGDTDSVMVALTKLTAHARRYLKIDDSSTPELEDIWSRHDAMEDPDSELFDRFCDSQVIRDAYFTVAEFLAHEFTKLCDAPMELECDGIMGRFNILTKKNYAALLWKSRDTKKPEIKSQGGAGVKRDRPACVRKCILEMTEHICFRKDFNAALETFANMVDKIKNNMIAFSDLFITREITAKARGQEQNLTAKVIGEFERKAHETKSNSKRLVFVAVNRDSKAQNDKFQEFTLALKGKPDNISRTYYLRELVNVISEAFGNIFGGSLFENIVGGQQTLPGQLSGHLTIKQNAKQNTKKKSSGSKNKKSKQEPQQSNTILSMFKPLSKK
jgi:DNA polymerase elongation subunit (family B)